VRPGLHDCGKRRVDRDGKYRSDLLLYHRNTAAGNVLPAHTRHIADTLAGKKPT
jgi:hypothetical protein